MRESVSKKTKSNSKAATVKKPVHAVSVGKKRKPKVSAAKVGKVNARRRAKAGKGKHRERVVEEFRSVVNLSREQLERWLSTPESRKLRFPVEPKGGNVPGQTILKILAKKDDKINSEDIEKMESVVEFIVPRLLKRPKGDIVASNWRYSLMNWGHDPSKPLKRTRGKQNGK